MRAFWVCVSKFVRFSSSLYGYLPSRYYPTHTTSSNALLQRTEQLLDLKTSEEKNTCLMTTWIVLQICGVVKSFLTHYHGDQQPPFWKRLAPSRSKSFAIQWTCNTINCVRFEIYRFLFDYLVNFNLAFGETFSFVLSTSLPSFLHFSSIFPTTEIIYLYLKTPTKTPSCRKMSAPEIDTVYTGPAMATGSACFYPQPKSPQSINPGEDGVLLGQTEKSHASSDAEPANETDRPGFIYLKGLRLHLITVA